MGEEQLSRLKSRAGASGSFVRRAVCPVPFPPPFPHISHYYFFVKSSGRFSELRQHAAYFRGEENNCICRQADLHYLNKDRSAPLSFTVYKWMKVLWQLRNYCKINSLDAHIFVCSYILSKPNRRKKYL